MHVIPQIVNAGVYDAALIHKKKTSTKPRRVSLFELELAVEDGGYSHIGQKTYSIKKGCAICAKPGQVRHTDLPYRCYYIHAIVEDEDLCAMLQAVEDFGAPTDSAKLEHAFCDLIAAIMFPDDSYGISTAAKFLEVLSLFATNALMGEASLSRRHRNTQVVQRAVAYMDLYYTSAITLADVAAHVHLSKIYFHNLFLAATGQTPHGYLLTKRISAVKFLLATTDKPMSEIALDCGFSSQSYMAYVFKQKTAYTPMQYKKQISLLWENA